MSVNLYKEYRGVHPYDLENHMYKVYEISAHSGERGEIPIPLDPQLPLPIYKKEGDCFKNFLLPLSSHRSLSRRIRSKIAGFRIFSALSKGLSNTSVLRSGEESANDRSGDRESECTVSKVFLSLRLLWNTQEN